MSEDSLRARCFRAREDLAAFVDVTRPHFEFAPFHHQICDALSQFFDDCLAGKQPRLLLMAPPRHGKSELVSRRFAAWVLGQRPDFHVAQTSYNQDLAATFARDVRAIMAGPLYQLLFPRASLVDYKGLAQTTQFDVPGGGGYYATGVGGGLTGRGADIIIIDDPIKDMGEATSADQRDRLWDWFHASVPTRLGVNERTGGGILVIMTRWHRDDLAGRLLEAADSRWRLLRFAAEYDPEFPDATQQWREAGEMLDPKRWPREKLIDAAANPYVWQSLYQQLPPDIGAGLFRSEWFPLKPRFEKADYRLITADTALKAGERNDYSVLQLWAKQGATAQLIEQVRGRFEAPELTQMATNFYQQNAAKDHNLGPIRQVWIEDAASGTGLIQQLRRYSQLPVMARTRRRGQDKVFRANNVLGHVAAGRVSLSSDGDFASNLLDELLQFPGGKHDDQVDALVDAVDLMFNAQTPQTTKPKPPKMRLVGMR